MTAFSQGLQTNLKNMAQQARSAPHKQRLFEVAYLGLSMLGSWLILRWALKQMDPTKHQRKAAKERKKMLAKRLGRPVSLEGYEEIVAQEVVNPRAIGVTLADIGGLDHVIEDLQRNVITPMQRPEVFRSSLLRQKQGVLLYGPPGTGKTMLAKALANECGACFINLKASTLLSKWYGDTNKLVAAVWSLAYKIQPTIIFIDEVDSLLGHRHSVEHEATTAMKTEFMQLWEGFETIHNNIVVLGATNKRDSLDDAVLRRFWLQYEVKLPSAAQREAILRLTLQRHLRELGPESVDASILHPPSSSKDWQQRRRQLAASSSSAGGDSEVGPALHWLAEATEGYSGSDLNELCSQAAAIPIHEHLLSGSAAPSPLAREHFERVLGTYTPPSRAAQAAQQRRRQRANGRAPAAVNAALMQQVVAAMAAMMSQPNGYSVEEEEAEED